MTARKREDRAKSLRKSSGWDHTVAQRDMPHSAISTHDNNSFAFHGEEFQRLLRPTDIINVSSTYCILCYSC